jgi:hypothetical protein
MQDICPASRGSAFGTLLARWSASPMPSSSGKELDRNEETPDQEPRAQSRADKGRPPLAYRIGCSRDVSQIDCQRAEWPKPFDRHARFADDEDFGH